MTTPLPVREGFLAPSHHDRIKTQPSLAGVICKPEEDLDSILLHFIRAAGQFK